MTQSDAESPHQKWAYFKFAVVGKLLANPPSHGTLGDEIAELSETTWRHPITDKPVRFAFSTIQTWYYQSRKRDDPVEALRRKVRTDKGLHKALPPSVVDVLREQYRFHPSWSYRLHYDNLRAVAEGRPDIAETFSYWTVFRYMKKAGMIRTKKRKGKRTEGVERAESRLERQEVRSYEVDYVNSLWHLDFHHAGRRILTTDGEWVVPLLLGIVDDRSRLLCHAQWYFAEDAECLVHGVCQAFQKRGLPRSIMMDNGAAMRAGETVQGLKRLGILQEFTLPYSPYQNGKQEVFWAQVEGRLLPMLESVKNLDLTMLNEATQAWVEMEYNRKRHASLGCSPLQRFASERDVGRGCPDSESLRDCFTMRESRRQRRGDGSVSIAGIRYEVPSRFRNVERVIVRYAKWDMSRIFMVDPIRDSKLCSIFPQDKSKNADGLRRTLPNSTSGDTGEPQKGAPDAPAPLLTGLMAEYAATGLPPAYISKNDRNKNKKDKLNGDRND